MTKVLDIAEGSFLEFTSAICYDPYCPPEKRKVVNYEESYAWSVGQDVETYLINRYFNTPLNLRLYMSKFTDISILYIPNGQLFTISRMPSETLQIRFEIFLNALNDDNGAKYSEWKLARNLPTNSLFSKEEFEIIYD